MQVSGEAGGGGDRSGVYLLSHLMKRRTLISSPFPLLLSHSLSLLLPSSSSVPFSLRLLPGIM